MEHSAMNKYRLQAKKGQSAFSQVFIAQQIETHKFVAIKCMKKKYKTIQKALKLLDSHQHIIKFIQVLYDEPTGKVALVFELMEQNLYQDKNSIQPLIDLQNLKRQPHMEIQNKSQLLDVKQTSINEINSKKDIYE